MTVRDFLLPDLGEGLTSAEVVHWLVGAGDLVAVDQAVVEVVTEKASVELPSPFAGTVTALHYREGETAEVGRALLSIDEAGGGSSGNVLVGYGTAPERARRRNRRAAHTSPVVTPAAAPAAVPPPPAAPAAALSPDSPVPPVVSPVVRRLAGERGVDLTVLEGSGPNGLITRADVEGAAPAEPSSPANPPAERRVPIRGLHRQMAELVSRSRREIPEATVWVDVDASGFVAARRALRAADPAGEGVTAVALLARFCVLGLSRWPLLNSRVEDGEVVLSDGVNLGFAAQTERGLVVPVVHGAEALGLRELDTEMRRLSTKARDGTLAASDVTGGTFTVNNYGVFGVDGSAAIIHHPQVAMVGMGRIVERPWVIGGDVVVRPVTELTLAFDHRACDGGVAGGFLRFVADCVEEPMLAL